MTHKLDHILWASPDLDEGTKHLAELLGVQPEIGGSHSGFGTRNSLLSLGDEVYLEIIAPDPAQELEGTRGEILAALPKPKLLTFAVRTFDMAYVSKLVAEAGLASKGAIPMSRRHPEGYTLEWQVLRLENHVWDNFMPFFIDWGDTKHPALTTPRGCELLDFKISYSDTSLVELYKALDIDVGIHQASDCHMTAVLNTAKGEVVLS